MYHSTATNKEEQKNDKDDSVESRRIMSTLNNSSTANTSKENDECLDEENPPKFSPGEIRKRSPANVNTPKYKFDEQEANEEFKDEFTWRPSISFLPNIAFGQSIVSQV